QTWMRGQPPGIGRAMCASTPLTGQSASLFLRPFNIILTLFSYLARAVAPRNSKRTPMGMGYLPVPVILKAYQRILVNAALPPKADTCGALADVCLGPIADMWSTNRCPLRAKNKLFDSWFRLVVQQED